MELYIVGFGPGNREGMTLEAEKILEKCDVICGYQVYVDLLKDSFPGKEYYATPMKQERERCMWALKTAAEGKKTAVVCSGDSGVYGMAGLIFQLKETMEECKDVDVKVISGVTAATSGAALLGAPLSHDFAVISLSDLLTPYEVITDRIRHAAMADMVICFYNPSSKKRQDYLKKACEIIMEYRAEETVCGYVKNIGRTGEETVILSLAELKNTPADMFTTVFIGNSTTKRIGDKMITPRGYQDV